MSLWAAAIVAAGIFFFTWKSRRAYLDLEELAPSSPDHGAAASSVTVIIPARNEAHNIRRCVESLVEQAAEVVVVDDGSTDATAEIAKAAGARIVEAPPLNPGFRGKPNACFAGATGITTRWLLFVDADTWYTPGFVPAIVQHAEELKLDLISAFLRNKFVTLWEHILVPYAFGLYFTGVNVEDVHSLKSREVLANGQCLLFRNDAYDFTGGHRSVIRSVIEDVEMARLAKRHRLRFEVIRAEKFGRVRMYDSLTAIWRGFQKNSFQFLDANPGVGFQVITASVLMTSYLPVLLWLIREGEFAGTLAFAVVPMLATFAWYRGSYGVLLAPVAIYVFQIIALHSMAAHFLGFGGVWKGRKVT